MALSSKKKKALIITSGIVVLLLLVIVGGIFFLKYKLKKELEKGISAALSASVSIGKVDIEWFSGKVMLADICVYDKKFPVPKPMLSIAAAGIIADTEKAFNLSNPVIDQIFITGCKIYITTYPNGSSNWDISGARSNGQDSVQKIIINRFDIDDAGIYVLNQQNRKGFRVNGIFLSYEKPTDNVNIQNLYLLIEETALCSGGNSIEFPRVELQGSLSSDSTGYIDISGNVRINQWFSNIDANYDEATGDYSFDWKTPECSIQDVAGIFTPINQKPGQITYTGSFASVLSVKRDSTTCGKPLVTAALNINNAEIINTANNTSIGGYAHCNFEFNPKRRANTFYHNDSILLYSGNDTLHYKLVSNISKNRNENTAITSGSFNLDNLNEIFGHEIYRFSGVISGSNPKSQSPEHALTFRNILVKYGKNPEKSVSLAGELSVNKNQYSLICTVDSNPNALVNLVFSLKTGDNIEDITPITFTALIELPELRIPWQSKSSGTMPDFMTQGKSFKSDFTIPYSTHWINDVSVKIGKVSIDTNNLGALALNYYSDQSKFMCELDVENPESTFLKIKLNSEAIGVNTNRVRLNTSFHFSENEISNTIHGNLSFDADIDAIVNDSLNIAANKMNGKISLLSDSLLIDEKIITDQFSFISGVISSDFLRIRKVAISCNIHNSEFELSDCKASVDKWKIGMNGVFAPGGNILLKTKLAVNPKELSFVEVQYLKRIAKKNNIDFSQFDKNDYLLIDITSEGKTSEPVNKIKFSSFSRK
ncbi:MAG TPA: hypothetical protein PLK75_06110 [Bacteroidales bacterium]|nr:hypothetical protein [Bacteroidales bacterium]